MIVSKYLSSCLFSNDFRFNSRVLGTFLVCITGCGYICNVCQWCLQLVYHRLGGMNCLWFYATKRPLELLAKAVDCLPVPVLFVSVFDIHRLYICDQRRRIVQSTQPLMRANKQQTKMMDSDLYQNMPPYIWFLIKICTSSPNMPLTRARTRLTYKKHPFPHLYCMHIRIQSFNWAGDSSNFWRLNSQCVHFWRLNTQCVTVTECTLASR